MSDQTDDFSSEVIYIVKLVTGEEIVGIVQNELNDVYDISFPARIDVSYGKGPGGATEFVKLSNYAASVNNYVVSIPKSATIFVGKPNDELKIMYLTYCKYMQENPKMIISSAGEDASNANEKHGLELLNELFNNSDFVEFVNELIDNYENSETIEIENEEHVEEEEEEIKPKKKKKVKNEGFKLPYNPEANPNTAEGWSDNPNDYIS